MRSKAMKSKTWQDIRMDWPRLRSHAKRAWPALHEAELEVVQGDRGRLIDKVRDAHHLSHEAAAEEVEAWRRSLTA